MADNNKDDKAKTSTVWSHRDETILIETLVQQKQASNWGDNNPKKAAWTACEAALAGKEKPGAVPKNVNAIKNRWQRYKKEYDIVKGMKEQSGWAWNPITRLPNVDVQVMTDYIEAHPKSKHYFTKPFPMYDDISDLLGDTRATGFASSDGRQNMKVSQAPSLALASTPSSFTIDPELEAISLEMQSTQGIDIEGAPNHADAGPSNKGKERAFQGLENERISSDEEAEALHRAASRKRVKDSPSTGNGRRKARRMSTADVISSTMDNSMEKWRDMFREAMTTPIPIAQIPPAPAVVAPAPVPAHETSIFSIVVSIMTNDAHFPPDEMDNAIAIFVKNPRIADMYIAIKDESARTRFLHRCLTESQAEKMYGIRMD